MTQEFDPLLGVARPTYGGAAFCLTRTVRWLPPGCSLSRPSDAPCNPACSPSLLLAAKIAASWLALVVLVLPVAFTMALWVGSGGHLGFAKLATLLAGGFLHPLFLACVSTAAAAWTHGVAPAATLAFAASLGAWVLDAAGEFAALNWFAPLGRGDLDSHDVTRASTSAGPDVMAIDPDLGWLYVSAESGDLTVFDISKPEVALIGHDEPGDHSHTVLVDQTTTGVLSAPVWPGLLPGAPRHAPRRYLTPTPRVYPSPLATAA